MAFEVVGNGLDQLTREEHPCLGRVDADVVEDRLELGGDEVRRNFVHRGHTDSVLRRKRNDRAHPVAARGGERLQVGLDPGAPARVGARDRETTLDWHELPSPA